MQELFWESQLRFIHDIFPPILIGTAVFLFLFAALFGFSLYRLYWLSRLGKEDFGWVQVWKAVTRPQIGKWSRQLGDIGTRLKTTLGVAFAHIRTLSEAYPGWMHFLIFWGALLLIGGKIVRLFSYTGEITDPPQAIWLYASLISEIGAMFIFIGGGLAIYRRYVLKPPRLDTKPDDTLILGWVFLILITGFMAKGFRIATSEVRPTDWAMWSPLGYAFSHLFLIFPGNLENYVLVWHRAIIHTATALVLAAYVFAGRSRLQHLWLAPINIFLRTLRRPKGALEPIDLEQAEKYGVSKIEDFSWKKLLDLEACVRCGRCQDNCPAWLSGKKLSPKKVIQDLKTHLHETYPTPFAIKPLENRRDMVTEAVTEEVLWDCTTCRACQQACPIYIEHVDKIVDMRRHLVLEESKFPETLQDALKGLGTRGHPWRGTKLTRTDWMKDLGVKTMAEGAGDIEFLYWVGCTAALDERNTKVAVAIAKILQAAGVNFAVLGEEESCCGDPARRSGDEYLFQTLCQRNIEVLKSYNVKKIMTACPHGLNTFRNEYPQFGGNFEVVHHTQVIADLIRQGKLKLDKLDGLAIAYHDSCYLGRYNDIYQEPREILEHTKGVRKVELSRCRERSFCCGAGGGHMWLEEPPDKRVNARRVEEVIQAKVDVVATACPYCLIMFEDALKAKNVEETIKARDISELVIEAAGLKEVPRASQE